MGIAEPPSGSRASPARANRPWRMPWKSICTACRTVVLGGDNVRHGLCADLGFSAADRVENIRRIGEVAKLFMEAGVIVLTAFISPFREDRNKVRAMVQPGEFIEIYCQCPIDVCEQRDVKGLYKKARAGEIAQFTGISSAYEPPDAPELVVKTSEMDLNNCVEQVLQVFLKPREPAETGAKGSL